MTTSRAIKVANELLALTGDSQTASFLKYNSLNNAANHDSIYKSFKILKDFDWDVLEYDSIISTLCQQLYTFDNVNDDMFGDGKILAEAIASQTKTIASATIAKKISDNIPNLQLQF